MKTLSIITIVVISIFVYWYNDKVLNKEFCDRIQVPTSKDFFSKYVSRGKSDDQSDWFNQT